MNPLFASSPLLKQFMRFCHVGMVNTLISLAVIFFLSEIVRWHYMLANLCGYGVGVTVSFFLNKKFTFQDRSTHRTSQFLKFVIVFIASYSLQLLVLLVCVHVLEIFGFMSQIIAIICYTGTSFIGNRLITFKQIKDPKTS